MRSVFLAILLWAGVAEAKIAPDNRYWLPEGVTFTKITKTNFDKAIDKVNGHYAPIVKAMGAELVFNRLWSDGTVNSDTTEANGVWTINAYGGLARYPGMTTAGYALVLCHELGHHMGGAPLYSGWGEWAATEGESDYWASKECMKAIGYTRSQIDAASLVLAKVLASLGEEPVPSKTKIDTTVVRRTFESHPAAQCRLDTYLNGRVCPYRGVMSKTNPRVNSCYDYPSSTTYALGSRPRCWFKP